MLNLLYGAFISILSMLYGKFYVMTRKTDTDLSLKRTWKLLLLNFCLNSVFLWLRSSVLQYPGSLLWMCLLLIADIDILIRKIPSELLLTAAAGCAVSVRNSADPVPVIICDCFLMMIGLLFNKKAGIARYDIFYICILAILCPDVAAILKFVSLFLILWGMAGLFIRKTDRSGRIRSIPLTPFILTAYTVSVLISLP